MNLLIIVHLCWYTAKALADSIRSARDRRSIDAKIVPRAIMYVSGRNAVERDSEPDISIKNTWPDTMKALIVSQMKKAIRRLMNIMISWERVSADESWLKT